MWIVQCSLTYDIPAFFAEQGVEYNDEHRNQKETPDSYRDYAPHDVRLAEGSLLYHMFNTDTLTGCPSWHHEAVKSVENTRLAVTGYAETNGIRIIEAVERTDKPFAVGLQFHPEAALVKHLENMENQNDFMDAETVLSLFRQIIREAYPEQADAA